MDYDLTRLGSREFEHLAQALAIRILGPAVQTFGDGPDGGREAEFHGELQYPLPDPGGPWNGHGVLQAKFLQRPRGTTHDTAWFLNLVRAELRQWANPQSKRAREGALPEYLLFCTNVVLSPDPETGGIDSFKRIADELLKELQLPIRDVRVWHFDQICRYLDIYPAIRQTYSGLITAGDVLFRLREIFEGTVGDLGELLANHSSKELATDQWVRLGQAGEADNQRLPLAELAIDPTASYVTSDGTHESAAVVQHIISHGNTVLSPRGNVDGPRHIALIGGPGQGKSTVGQILCQTYRAILLGDAVDRLDDETKEILTTFTDEMKRIGLSAPAARRWPVRINLSEYADAVAGGEIVSILRYLSELISRRTPDITAGQLRSWLRTWPWLLVLDGLDEVASTQARDTVMERVNDFLLEAASVDADLLVVATSRPQGYREEFSPQRYVHMRLEPMAAEDAVSYAAQLAQLRHRGDPETAERVLRRLEEAAEEDLTARLMTTPLQVTIMAILLERRERVPQQRYRLFYDYYQAVYNREASKSGPTARLIDDHRNAINYLHERAGLLLQVKSEKDGESDASLSRAELFNMIETHLRGEGFDDAASSALATRMVDAAMRRLILLVPRKQDSVGFDVRSLQEFMAARAMVSEDSEELSDLLTETAASAHWRNTWLLAAGQIFHERPGLRDRLIVLLDEIQAKSEISLFTKPGSSLAVGLLSDDVAAQAPRFLRALTKIALELLEEPLDEIESIDLCEALWNVADSDSASQWLIKRVVDRNVEAGGYRAANTLATLGINWEREAGPLAYHVRKIVERASRNQNELAYLLGSKVMWPRHLVNAINRGSIKFEQRPLLEVLKPYLRPSAWERFDRVYEEMFEGDLLGFMRVPTGHHVTLQFQHTVVSRNAVSILSVPQAAEELVFAAEALPVEMWQLKHQIRVALQTAQEREPVNLGSMALP
ncbi:NACHT domain-containing protein [Streptomyces sp. NPDC001978]|uniref:NACHT domain-containing protein n=1 Tax=Streptomyces sp. NPDC001978 TaxID=3364627 RepID=UPI003685EF08